VSTPAADPAPAGTGAEAITALEHSLADVVSRLSVLEHAPAISLPDSIAVPNIYNINTKGVTNIGGLAWRGGWNAQRYYQENNVVRFNGKTYICVEEVPEAVLPSFGPLPPLAAQAKLLGVIQPEVPFEDEILPTDPELLFRGEHTKGTQNASCRAYEIFGTAEEIIVTLPPGGPDILFTLISQTNVEEFPGKEAEKLKVKGGGPTHTFYLIVFARHEGGHVGEPRPFTVLLSGEKLLASPGNLNPAEDPGHWRLFAD